MAINNDLVKIDNQLIHQKIIIIRSLPVMIDRDLSVLYEVENKRLNEQVKRNIGRFPERFRFQLTQEEKNELVANCDRFELMKHSTTLPYAFTEQGVSMLSAVLRSDTAIKISIQIMDAFVDMRKFITNNAAIFQRLDHIEHKQLIAETKLDKVFEALEAGELKPSQGIFFDGQIFDAYLFVSKLIKTATQDIVLVDNYIDESVLKMLGKRGDEVSSTVYTKNISNALRQDIKKYNQQYPPIFIKHFSKAHDRFLIIDKKTIYHFGASLKDLGKKWFAFSKMELDATEILEKLSIGAENE
ncbi:MAG: ORF6N domain-containing protein [gamma proteobacterium symbiont of Bathyaustriella thionipta]|nr:ORF6N domain-containing protein [gamma proteobacterium symbiont of Bathyaustriella thionipta]MCU7951349.1 ORF6N domain-containing protein [gamma proteobacterium symbiont of Bathyaustriella thionipta]MCU7954815.1 ORF6N domain-containing protein [gamma proteobacterium symbiont of Bathyaustriella thionipta]MCU7957902.1 ORF6N domain-containing protein [gamma proteobacterium symbiont of Bathyaustriella thionipta]MCU7968109.1 ORF6N domain-containing protein [gamma proteobacterium symbiont of Bathy